MATKPFDQPPGDEMTTYDKHGTAYTIVAAHGRPGRYHVNRNEWSDDQKCYSGAFRVASNLSLDEATQYVSRATSGVPGEDTDPALVVVTKGRD